MPVLVEAVNVIVRNETIAEKYPGGLGGYWMESPNISICSDDFVTRVGFPNPELMHTFLIRLIDLGFVLAGDPDHTEIAVVDQLQGLMFPCGWLHIADHADGFRFAALRGDLGEVVEKPQGWCYDTSVTEHVRKQLARDGGRRPPAVSAADLARWLESLIAVNNTDETICSTDSTKLRSPTGSPTVSARLEGSFTARASERPAASAVADGWLSDEEVELRSRHLVATHGDTTRPVWIVEPCGESYLIGDVKVRDVPRVLSNAPANCLLIAAVETNDLIGVVMPAYPIDEADDDGLTNAQRTAVALMTRQAGIKGPDRMER